MRVLLLLLAMLLLFGCTAQQPETQMQEPEPVVIPPEPEVQEVIIEEPEPTPEPEPEPIKEPEPALEPEECTSTIEPHQMKMIKLNLDDDYANMITRTEEDISFRLFPLDSTGKEIIPVDGNLGIQLWSTEIGPNGEIEEDEIVYAKSYYIKAKEVMPDCGSKPITLNFEEILDSETYQKYDIRDNDPGVLYVSFKRSGSPAKYEFKYEAFKYDTRVLP